MTKKGALTLAVLIGVAGFATSSVAQVAYRPYAPLAPTPYGFPVPFGFLQPNEVLGTSPSYVISTNPYAPAVGVELRCQYPNGWNQTDYLRDQQGIPNGVSHTCPAPGYARVRARY